MSSGLISIRVEQSFADLTPMNAGILCMGIPRKFFLRWKAASQRRLAHYIVHAEGTVKLPKKENGRHFY